MADVAQLEHLNKMNACNVAMVFAPNMTKHADPLTALMFAVQVMNFLKTLVMKTLREREESMVKSSPTSNLSSFGDDGHQSSSLPIRKDGIKTGEAIVVKRTRYLLLKNLLYKALVILLKMSLKLKVDPKVHQRLLKMSFLGEMVVG